MAHPFLPNEMIPANGDIIEQQVVDLIQRCVDATGADDFVLCLTGPGNFRNEIAKEQPYKGNRADMEKPFHWKTVNDVLFNRYGDKVVLCEGYEADDYMAFHRFEDNDEVTYTICSRDKDLETVPGWHYRWACGENQPEKLPYHITPFRANRFFLYQCLIGDNTDNIPGCGRKEMTYWGAGPVLKSEGYKPKKIKKLTERGLRSPMIASYLEKKYGIVQVPRRKGIGSTEAEGILRECETIGEMVEAVRQAYQDRFTDEDWEAILLENARLLYMGQTMDKLFQWSWLDDVLELKDE